MHVRHIQSNEVGHEWTNSIAIMYYLLLAFIVVVVVLLLMVDKGIWPVEN